MGRCIVDTDVAGREMKGAQLAARYVRPILTVDGVCGSVSGVLASRGQWEIGRSVSCERIDAQADSQLAVSALCTDGQGRNSSWNREDFSC
jgi:hypothetical protein